MYLALEAAAQGFVGQRKTSGVEKSAVPTMGGIQDSDPWSVCVKEMGAV